MQIDLSIISRETAQSKWFWIHPNATKGKKIQIVEDIGGKVRLIRCPMTLSSKTCYLFANLATLTSTIIILALGGSHWCPLVANFAKEQTPNCPEDAGKER